MLYDGAIRFCEQAREAIEARQIEDSYNLITKAQKIVMELASSMKDEVAPETCANMRRLYFYCYDRMVDANLKKEVEPIDDALKILREIRQTWVMLVEKVRDERAEQAQQNQAEPVAAGSGPASLDGGSTINFEG